MKILFNLFIGSIFFVNSFSQTSFSDGFETGDFSRWDDNVGVTISNLYHHTGNYSAKFVDGGLTLTKNNPVSIYSKIDFYAYVQQWNPWYTGFGPWASSFWGMNIFASDVCYIDKCNAPHSTPSINLPINLWNHVEIERMATGYVYVKINGVQFIDGIDVGGCSYENLHFGQWRSYSSNHITVYIDDVNFTYLPIGIKPISSEVPSEFSLSQNYPNPFNPTTNIKFELPKQSDVKLIIYDALGREVTTLVNEKLNAGSYSVDWDATNYPSGVYYYMLKAEEFVETMKMVLIK